MSQRLSKLSILMPVYNEQATLHEALKRLLDVHFPCELEVVCVDDGSADATPDILGSFSDPRLRVIRHPVNRGKGAAIRTAIDSASGDYCVMYDADLEYAPEDLPRLVEPILHGEAQVVFGTRSFGSHTAYSFWYVMGNKLVTHAANILYNSWISDLETCYKMLPVRLLRELDIKQSGFGMEPEITAKLLTRGIRPYEVPISYRARSREEGKKLTWRDGVEALWVLLRLRLVARIAR
ncbi:MAG: glycosyltransferase family 2 protein [Actinomycetes bacterium]